MLGCMSYCLKMLFVNVALSAVQLGMLAGCNGLLYIRVVVGLLGYLSVKFFFNYFRGGPSLFG